VPVTFHSVKSAERAYLPFPGINDVIKGYSIRNKELNFPITYTHMVSCKGGVLAQVSRKCPSEDWCTRKVRITYVESRHGIPVYNIHLVYLANSTSPVLGLLASGSSSPSASGYMAQFIVKSKWKSYQDNDKAKWMVERKSDEYFTIRNLDYQRHGVNGFLSYTDCLSGSGRYVQILKHSKVKTRDYLEGGKFYSSILWKIPGFQG